MRVLALTLAAAFPALAQLALFTGAPERAIGQQYHFGSVAAGHLAAAQFRLKNVGTGAADATLLEIAGAGFSLAAAPALPLRLAPGELVEFTVRFAPPAPGAYSASLRVSGVSALLLGLATPAAAVQVEQEGAWRTLVSGDAVDFGTVERGSSVTRRFAVSNRTGEAVPPVELSVAGPGFGFASAPPAATPLPGETLPFEVVFRPPAAGVFHGELVAGGRRYALRAAAFDPPLPVPELILELPEARSASQGRVRVRLAAPARARAAGLVRLEFRPDTGIAPDDPAVVFATGAREVAFHVEAGEAAARFGAGEAVHFQTGSTAGTLVFKLEAGSFEERRSIRIEPAPPGITGCQAVRKGSSIEVQVGGYDNTHAAAEAVFTFFDRDGARVEPGALRADVAGAFRRYFADSGLGGVFVMRAVFPVTGDAERIGSVEVRLSNPAGEAGTGPVRF